MLAGRGMNFILLDNASYSPHPQRSVYTSSNVWNAVSTFHFAFQFVRIPARNFAILSEREDERFTSFVFRVRGGNDAGYRYVVSDLAS